MDINELTYERLCLALHDEVYLVDISKTAYFMADDHYTHVYYVSGTHFMVPFGLNKIEDRLKLYAVHNPHSFMRLGRKYIVNLKYLYHINTAKQQLALVGDDGKNTIIQLPKPILRDLTSLLSNSL